MKVYKSNFSSYNNFSQNYLDSSIEYLKNIKDGLDDIIYDKTLIGDVYTAYRSYMNIYHKIIDSALVLAEEMKSSFSEASDTMIKYMNPDEYLDTSKIDSLMVQARNIKAKIRSLEPYSKDNYDSQIIQNLWDEYYKCNKIITKLNGLISKDSSASLEVQKLRSLTLTINDYMSHIAQANPDFDLFSSVAKSGEMENFDYESFIFGGTDIGKIDIDVLDRLSSVASGEKEFDEVFSMIYGSLLNDSGVPNYIITEESDAREALIAIAEYFLPFAINMYDIDYNTTWSNYDFINSKYNNLKYISDYFTSNGAYYPWCARYVSLIFSLAEEAGGSDIVFDLSNTSRTSNMLEQFKGKEAFFYSQQYKSDNPDGEEYIPLPGDVVFFDLGDGGGKSVNHVGIVKDIIEIDGKMYLRTIEGNRSTGAVEASAAERSIVTYCLYPIDDPQIIGYGNIIK